jgi:hypothetical protein
MISLVARWLGAGGIVAPLVLPAYFELAFGLVAPPCCCCGRSGRDILSSARSPPPRS